MIIRCRERVGTGDAEAEIEKFKTRAEEKVHPRLGDLPQAAAASDSPAAAVYHASHRRTAGPLTRRSRVGSPTARTDAAGPAAAAAAAASAGPVHISNASE